MNTSNPVHAAVTAEQMRQVYDEVKTPFKYGVVIRGEENQLLDSPSVFRKDGQWYMVYINSIRNVGYETCLARSQNLLHWEKMGNILSFPKEGWDRWQRAGLPRADSGAQHRDSSSSGRLNGGHDASSEGFGALATNTLHLDVRSTTGGQVASFERDVSRPLRYKGLSEKGIRMKHLNIARIPAFVLIATFTAGTIQTIGTDASWLVGASEADAWRDGETSYDLDA